MTKLTLVPANAGAPKAPAFFEVGPQLTVVIGREAGCDVLIDESQDMVSRRHASIRLEGDELVVVDSSSNGLFINSERIAGLRRVHDEDVLQLGPNGPMLAIALDPKPARKPPPAKATRLYTPVVAPSVASGPAATLRASEAGSHAGATGQRAPAADAASVYLDKAQESVSQAHGWLTQVFTHPLVFVLAYLFFMLLTYYLPVLGSNSSVAAVIHAAAESVNKPFWAHLFSLGMLVAIAWYRGRVIGKTWIMIFPIIATVFDLAPLLNWIPLIPTFMHVAALIMGARGQTA